MWVYVGVQVMPTVSRHRLRIIDGILLDEVEILCLGWKSPSKLRETATVRGPDM